MGNSEVVINSYGYYQLSEPPTDSELQRYYEDIYYQESKSLYTNAYSEEEILYFKNKYKQKFHVLMDHNIQICSSKRYLDIGCGEGWGLSFFHDLGWEVVGLDHSNYGCKTHNPNMLPFLSCGAPIQKLKELKATQQVFDVIWLDNVLEHLKEPLEMLKYCYSLLSDNGFLVVEVPNDFSVVQNKLLLNGDVDDAFWVVSPDHISYFNKDGLMNLCSAADLDCVDLISDYAIDFDLFNENTNYKKDATLGKASHKARIEIENLIHSISIESANNLYRVYAELGIGRQITGFFRKRVHEN